jgi:spore germination protein GerM
MSDPTQSSHRAPRDDLDRGSRRGRVLFWLLFLLIVGGGAVVLFWPRVKLNSEDGLPMLTRPGQPVGLRSVVLYFAEPNAEGLVTERREIPVGAILEERVEATLRALIAGPDQQGALPVLPREAQVMQSFFDEETGVLFVDFNTALVTQQPGGSTAEYYSLSALVRTLGANFPEVTAVQILVDGQPIDSLAGHFDTSKPLDVATWQ